MQLNMGATDRTIRILIAVAIAVLYVLNVISGWLAIVLGVIAVVFLLTGFTGFCPGYLPFRFSTRPGGPQK